MMDSITFQIDDVLMQIANGEVRFWSTPLLRGIYGNNNDEPDVVIPIAKLQSALGAAFMLNRGDTE